MDLELTGKNVLITGGSSGIGFAVAKRFLEEGANVMITGRDRARLDRALTELNTIKHARVLACSGDMVNVMDIARIHETAMAEFGSVDILFNNAGTGSEEKIIDAPDERWQYYWDLQVMATVRLSRLCVPSMAARGGGVIINNVSICALQPLDHEPIYNVTKAALAMLGKCMANEFIAHGIRVNTLNPGFIITAPWEDYAKRATNGTSQSAESYLDKIVRQYAPIGRFGTPLEVADFVVFLASPRASYCLGASFYVDGGLIKTVC